MGVALSDNTVDVHIGRLRKSLKEVSNKNLIRTIRGFGYSLDSVD
jgi:DNA-binding response OmpR family regulator